PAASLGVAYFPGEYGFLRRSAATIKLEILISQHLHYSGAQCLRGPAQGHITGRIGRSRHSAKLAAALVDDALAANDYDVLLQVVQVSDTFDQQLDVERVFGNQDDIRLSVSRSEGDVAGLPSHDFDDCDTAMTFSRSSHPFDALGGDHDCGRISWSHIVHDVIEVEDCIRWGPFIAVAMKRFG